MPVTDTPARLYVYEIGPDHIIAHDEDDAWELWCRHHGERRSDYKGEPCTRVDDDVVLSIIVDAAGRISDSGAAVELSAREWVQREGRGFLCSTEV